jgi:murein DD-endopeptidase MepM/ murein hydrolase activator NlpD
MMRAAGEKGADGTTFTADEVISGAFQTIAGTVKSVARNATYGLYVEIDHGSGVVTLYAHCSQVVVKPKDTVKAGQTIAKAGQTGNATGVHLHFEVQLNGQTIDPAPQIGVR